MGMLFITFLAQAAVSVVHCQQGNSTIEKMVNSDPSPIRKPLPVTEIKVDPFHETENDDPIEENHDHSKLSFIWDSENKKIPVDGLNVDCESVWDEKDLPYENCQEVFPVDSHTVSFNLRLMNNERGVIFDPCGASLTFGVCHKCSDTNIDGGFYAPFATIHNTSCPTATGPLSCQPLHKDGSPRLIHYHVENCRGVSVKCSLRVVLDTDYGCE